VSNIVIEVSGSGTGDGFLIAPDNGITFSVPLSLSTNDGSTVSATIDATPNGGGIAVPGGSISIGPSPTVLHIFATAASASRGDTVINVHVGAVETSFSLTAISSPQIGFQGRFEARFATDGDYYNDARGSHGTGTASGGTTGSDPGFGGAGWTWALEGEPDFVPAGSVAASVPNPITQPVGRVVRFNHPVALRQFAAPVATTVNEISGSTTGGTETFTTGDPVFGATVDLGPDTYLAANQPTNPADPQPAEQNVEGFEPMNLFEFHINGFFSGESANLTDRPTANNVVDLDAAEKAIAQFIDPATGTAKPYFDQATFEAARLMQLQNAYNALTPADRTGTVAGRNLKTRIDMISASTTLPQGWSGKEEYTGKVNAGIAWQPNAWAVMEYFAGYTDFTFFGKLFTFHSDELCGYVHGNLTVDSAARLTKTCSFQIQNSTFGKDELISKGLPATFPSAFWVVMDGFFPPELGIDATGNLTNPANPPVVTLTVDPTNANAAAITNALVTMGEMQIEPFTGPLLAATLPPADAPQRFLYPFTVAFTGTDGFIDQTETLTVTASITVNGKTYGSSAPLILTTAANPYVTDADAGNQYTSWLSTDLRVFSVDDDKPMFGKRVSDFYPAGAVAAQYPVTAAAASAAATAYIADVIARLTPTGTAGADSFDTSLTEAEDATGGVLEYLQVNPRTHKAAFNFAICRVRIRGTTPPYPPPPFTTQASNCRVFFRAFQAQNTDSTFDPSTTYRSTPIGVPDVTPRVPLLGVQADSMGQDEVVTIPFLAVARVNLMGVADLTTQPPDAPNVQTISPQSGSEIDTYYGCWLDMNQPTPLLPQFVKANDFDNATGYFGTAGFDIQSINAAFTRAPHQCLIAEIAFDDVPIPHNADSSTSDKLAQRNLAYIDGPNPGVPGSRRMPHPFQIRASSAATRHVDELMITWGTTPPGSTASIYLPGASASDILGLADAMYPYHTLTVQDPYTITTPTGTMTFVPIPRSTGFIAGLLTVDLSTAVRHGDVHTVVVRQLTDVRQFPGIAGFNPKRSKLSAQTTRRTSSARQPSAILEWRRVLGTFQINLTITQKEKLLVPEEHRLALFKWIADGVLPESRWYPVMQRYVLQLGSRVTGFGGNPTEIPPSPTGHIPGAGDRDGRDPDEHDRVTGKVVGLVFDRFGDFEGFVVETKEGEVRTFRSRERRVLELVTRALEERILITVVHGREPHGQMRSIILRRARGRGTE